MDRGSMEQQALTVEQGVKAGKDDQPKLERGNAHQQLITQLRSADHSTGSDMLHPT